MTAPRHRLVVLGAGTAFVAIVTSHLTLMARISAAGAADLLSLADAGFWPAYAGMAASALAGFVIAVRQPSHPVGWLFIVVAGGLGALALGSSYGVYGALARPGALPAPAHVASLTQAVFPIPNAAVALILLLTPTGRFLNPRWRRVGIVAVASALAWTVLMVFDPALNGPPVEAIANPFAIEHLARQWKAINGLCALVNNGCLLLAAASLVVRFRAAEPDERRQLLWLAMAALWIPVAAFGAMIATLTGHPGVVSVFGGSLLALLPLATLPAVQRYRLYGVERLLSQAVTYVLLTAAVLGASAAVAITVGAVLGGLANDAEIAVGLATFTATVLIGPARRRIQDAVDRRFNRRAHEALRQVRRHLATPESGRSIEAILADALGDPSLTVAYSGDEPGTWVTREGRPVAPPGDALVVRRLDEPVAVVQWLSPEVDRSTVVAAATEAMTELENERLRAALARQLVEVRESRSRIIAAQLAERRALERNLHDGAQQRLVATTLHLRAAVLADGENDQAPTINRAIEEISLALQELRDIASGLHPAVLVDGGLAASFEDLARRTPVEVVVEAEEERFPPEVEATAWYVACEAVANAIKHACPRRIQLRAARSDARLVLVVADDGIGGVDHAVGLASIRDRVAAADGRLRVESPPGGGTTITVELPCGS